MRDSGEDGAICSDDTPWQPPLAALPAGSVRIGAPEGDPERDPDESPQRRVELAGFAIGVRPVTFAEWDFFAAAGRRYRPSDMDWGRGARPVINVSWQDCQAYLTWLSQATGDRYRLPTEAEWEYAARAGTQTRFWWGEVADRAHANFSTKRGASLTEARQSRRTEPAGSYLANPWGLQDMLGNVWEWCADGWPGAPGRRVLRGGAWDSDPRMLRVSYRTHLAPWVRMNNAGFRVVRELPGGAGERPPG